MKTLTVLSSVFILFFISSFFQQKKQDEIDVIAYYSGDRNEIDDYRIEKLTHIIYSFAHLKGNKLMLDNYDAELTVKHLVSLKKKNPNLKIQIALGGWGGCASCSGVFEKEKGRVQFAESVKKLLEKYHLDGIDLDWEYPGIEGKPQHRYILEDKENFTKLLDFLRFSLQICKSELGVKKLTVADIKTK